MITGTVNADYEAVIRLQVQGPTGHAQEVDALIDTGFNGFLTLPPALVTALGLPRRSRGRAQLANGREELFDIYGVTVKKYATTSRFTEDTGVWWQEAWSIVLEFDAPPAAQGTPSMARARFLAEQAPVDRLQPGRAFELYEGKKQVALVEIVG